MPTTNPAWPETTATVTACHYDFGAGQALAFGYPMSKHFRIAFTYTANGEQHTGEYRSATAVPQGTTFPMRYDPEAPHQHDVATAQPGPRRWLLPATLAASLVLALACLTLLHGCA